MRTVRFCGGLGGYVTSVQSSVLWGVSLQRKWGVCLYRERSTLHPPAIDRQTSVNLWKPDSPKKTERSPSNGSTSCVSIWIFCLDLGLLREALHALKSWCAKLKQRNESYSVTLCTLNCGGFKPGPGTPHPLSQSNYFHFHVDFSGNNWPNNFWADVLPPKNPGHAMLYTASYLHTILTRTTRTNYLYYRSLLNESICTTGSLFL